MNELIVQKTSKKIKKSKQQILLERLQSGERLTVRKIQQQMWINSPTKAISLLRADGHLIEDIIVKTKNSHYKEYFMNIKEEK